MYNKIYRHMRFLCILTLLLSAVIMLSAYYTAFTSDVKSDLQKEALVLSEALNSSDDALSYLKRMESDWDKLRLTLISPDGEVLFDSHAKEKALPRHTDRPEFIPAQENGIGEAERHSSSISERCYYCAVKLDDGTVFRIAQPVGDAMAPFYTVLVFILFMIVLIYIVSAIISARLTDDIITPLADISLAEQYTEIRPLTEKIQLQNKEIKRQIEHAKAQKRQHQLITDNMNEGLVVIDKNGIILSLNNFAMKIFDKYDYDVRQNSFTVLTDNEVFISAVTKALECNRATALVEMGELDYRVFCSPVMKNDALSGVVILLFDVTSTSQSEKLRREFSANVSHELKTPLTSINGYAQIISNGLAASDDIPDFAAKIAKESNRLMILIEDIIRLSNLDEGAPHTEEKTSFSLKETVLDTIASLQEKADKRSLTMHCDGGDFCIRANKSQIIELIYNLCDNAIKYNKDGGSVTFTMAENTLSISDTGIGIPGEYLGRIFERFFRVDKSHSKKVDGTGLGLSIVKHIAKQNNIEIDVKSTPDVGTTFTLTFDV